MQKKLELFIKILIGLSFVMPIIVVTTGFIFPFIVPKILFFRITTLLMAGGFLILLSINWHYYKIRLTAINISVAVFFVSFLLSTFIGADWYHSMWDNHERMLGLFTIFHYILYYLIITSLVKKQEDWQWLFRFFLLAGGLVMLFGFWQKFGNSMWLLNRGASRVSATLGNPIYFSGYGLFLLFLGTLSAIKEKGRVWFWIGFAIAFLGFVGIFLGGTRGTFLGLAVGVGVLILSYAFFLRGHKKLRVSFGVVAVAMILIAALLFIFRQTGFVKNIPAVGGLLNASSSQGSAQTRVMAWQIAVEGWKDRPVFGWGPNNFFYAFNQYYKPEFLEHGWQETWFDNAHSAIMNTLNVQGILGLLAYLAIFFVPSFILLHAHKKKGIDAHLVSLCLAFLAAHFVHNAFVFENPTSYMYFFFLLAFINQQTLVAKTEEKQLSGKSLPVGFTVFVGCVILLFIYSTNVNPARANIRTLSLIKDVYAFKDITETYKQVLQTPSPHIDDIRSDFVRTVVQTLPQYLQPKKNDLAESLFALAYEESKKNLELHPLDVRNNLERAELLQIGADMKKDASLLFEAEALLEDALLKSPRRQQIQYTLAWVKLRLGKGAEAIDILQTSVNNDPKIGDGWHRLAIAYKHIGDEEKAKEVINQAVEKGARFTKDNKADIKELFGMVIK